ncbi:MAG TPA: amidase [Blastocatellia bacterium]|nr:amidase [Blastocatellia bacterium]
MLNEETFFAPVRQLAAKIRSRQISSVELTEGYLDRLEKIGPRLGAVVTITRDLAMKEAKAADREIRAGKYRGPLHGIPYGVKDLLATAGIPTTWGAAPYKNQVFNYDATVVTKLRKAGAVLVAKLAMIELAGGLGYNNPDASFTGPTRTPWNLGFWSGGSSSGPGSATAAGLVGFSIGSETSGSIVTPSAYCGLAGLRPTYGRVSRHGAMALCWTLDKLGPICRSADDCGLVLAAIAGVDPADPTSVALPFTYSQTSQRTRRFKIGVLKNATSGCQPEVQKNFEDSLKVLSEFADLDDTAEFPTDLQYGVVGTIVAAEGASAFREIIENGKVQELQTPRDRIGGFTAMTVFAVDYIDAMRHRVKVQKGMEAVCAKYDAVVAPSRNTVASPIDVDFDKAFPEMRNQRPGAPAPPVIAAGNLAGQPAISVPNGFGQNGLPTGIQFQGKAFSEDKLLAIANAYQKATDWHTKHPKV